MGFVVAGPNRPPAPQAKADNKDPFNAMINATVERGWVMAAIY